MPPTFDSASSQQGGMSPNSGALYTNMIMSGIGMVGNIFGGIQGMNRLGDVIRARNDAAALVRDHIGQNVMPAGAAWGSMYQPAYGGLMDFANGFSAGGFNVDPLRMGFTNTQGRLDDFYNSLGNYSQPNYNNPFFDNYYMPQMFGNQGRMDYGMDSAFDLFNSGGWNPGMQGVYDSSMGMLGSPYMQSPFDIGNFLMSSGGATGQNEDIMSQGLHNIRQGGWDPRGSQMFDMGAGAFGLGQNGMQQGMGLGLGLMNSPFSSQASGLMNYGMQGLNQFANNQNPEQFLGPRGSRALDSLQNSPYIGGLFGSGQDYMRNAMQGGGYTPQDSWMFDQSGGRGFQEFDYRNQQLDEDRNAVLGNLIGNRDYLPDWYENLKQLALGPQGIGGMGSGGGIDVSGGGGGGGGVSAPTISRDLGPIDPELKERIDKAFAIFDNNPLMSTEQAVNLARNRALSDAKAGFGQAQRRAVQLGGMGPRTAGGGAANEALFQNEDAALEAMSKATGDARFAQQNLALERAGQGAQLSSVLQGLKADREKMFMNANIADAQNQMQASSINAQMAESAANRQMQAQSMNAQNQIAMAQMRSAMMQGLLNNATELRGQNINNNLGSLGMLQGMQNTGTQRMGMMFDNMNQAGNRANQRFGLGAQGFSPMGQAAGLDIDRYSSIINPLVAGQNTATSRAGLFSGMPGQGLTAGLNSQDSRIGTGAGLFGSSAGGLFSGGQNMMNNASNNATNRYGMGAGMFSAGAGDQLSRMNLGMNMNNNAMGNYGNFLNIGNTASNNMANYGLGAGNLGNAFVNSSNNMWNNNFNNYRGIEQDNLNRAQFGLSGFNAWNNANNGMFSNIYFPGLTMANSNYNNISNQAMQYMLGAQGLYGPYMSMMGSGMGAGTNLLGGLGK